MRETRNRPMVGAVPRLLAESAGQQETSRLKGAEGVLVESADAFV